MVISLIGCFIFAALAGIVKTSGGSVRAETITWAAQSGHILSGQLFVPKEATIQSPAPAIVIGHGWQNASEKQDLNYIELSRRGYVVLSLDMYGHGDSETVPNASWWEPENAGNGIYDGVKMLMTLPYVDSSKIGITGTSNGGFACNVAVTLDNAADVQLISSVFIVCCDPIYTTKEDLYYSQYFQESDKDYYNAYGSRDVGVLADKYDEIFYRIRKTDGSVTTPLSYPTEDTAQSFLHFGTDPSGLDVRSVDTFYTQNVGGKDAVRIIYYPSNIHVLCNWSAKTVNCEVDFFNHVMPSASSGSVNGQIWKWKSLFNVLGLAAAFTFFTSFILVMLDLPYFSSLKASETPILRSEDKKGKRRMWRGLIICGLVSAILFPVIVIVATLFQPAFFNQQRTFSVGLWACACAVINLILIRRFFKKHAPTLGTDPAKEGVKISGSQLFKTILLSVLAVTALYGIVFCTTYLFGTDFRFWDLVTLKTFKADKLLVMLKFLPFFLFYYITLSITINANNRLRIGRKDWVNTLILCIFNSFTPLLYICLNLLRLFSSGKTLFDEIDWGTGSIIFYIINLLILLPLATIISRLLYKKTRNPYLSGIAYALLVTVSTCSTSLTTSVF